MIKPAGADSARLRVGEFTKEQSTHDHRGVSPYVLAEALFDATGKKKTLRTIRVVRSVRHRFWYLDTTVLLDVVVRCRIDCPRVNGVCRFLHLHQGLRRMGSPIRI